MAYDPARPEGNDSLRRIPTANWRFRFDVPPSRRDLLAAFDGDLFGMLHLLPWQEGNGARGGHRDDVCAAPSERREGSRVTPAEAKVMIGWWGGGEFVVFSASIVNVCAGGSRIELAAQPPSSQPVWLCSGEPKLTAMAQGRVLDVLKTSKGVYQARLLFHAPCPPAFLEAVGNA